MGNSSEANATDRLTPGLSPAPDEVRFFYARAGEWRAHGAARRPERRSPAGAAQGQARVHGGGAQPGDHAEDPVRRHAPQGRRQGGDRVSHGWRLGAALIYSALASRLRRSARSAALSPEGRGFL